MAIWKELYWIPNSGILFILKFFSFLFSKKKKFLVYFPLLSRSRLCHTEVDSITDFFFLLLLLLYIYLFILSVISDWGTFVHGGESPQVKN